MKLDKYIDLDNPHHAYLIEGESAEAFTALDTLLAARGVIVAGNPDVTKETYELFTIDDARALRARMAERAVDGEAKYIALAVRFFMYEAENALLKVFEEPVPGTHFFVVVPNADFLLPTLRSRFALVRTTDARPVDDRIAKGKAFLKKSTPERLAQITAFIEEYADEEKHDAQKGAALAFLDSVERALVADRIDAPLSLKMSRALKEIWKCKDFMRDRGASTKMLLEHVALVLP